MKTDWVHCPICGRKTRIKIRPDTTVRNFPLFCPICKSESIIDIEKMKITLL